MVATPPPVPTKNALRALRRLALSSPTVVVGALGSFCAAASLHYDARRKIRVAEQIIETKRTLHSVSNGNGSLHLVRLIEAAERGDDFTLASRGKKRKKQKVRNHSSVAVQQAPEQEDLEANF